MFGLSIKMTLTALVQHKTKICSVDYHYWHWNRSPNLYHLDFLEASVIISQASGSRTIVYNPGNQEPLKASEFVMALKRMPSTFQWIHFEARPFVNDMLSYLLSDRKVRSQILYQIGLLKVYFKKTYL